MSQDEKVLNWYNIWKEQGLNHDITNELSAKCGVSVQTLGKWRKRPIVVKGVKYANWDNAYEGEEKARMEEFRKEIEKQLNEDYKLSDVLANEIIMKYIEKVKRADYTPTLNDLKVAVGIQDRKRESMNKADENKGGAIVEMAHIFR